MKKKLFVALATCALAFCQANAGSIYGITADGNSDEFLIGDVRSIKIAPKQSGLTSYNSIKFSTSSTQTNSEETPSRFLMVYPNPVSEYITISGVDEDVKVAVVSMDGEVMMTGKGSKVEVSNLNQGTYVLIVNGEKVKFIKK